MQSFQSFALDFFAQRGYTSPLQFDQSLTLDEAIEELELAPTDITRRALDDEQSRIHLLFQFTADQLQGQNGLFKAQPDRDLYEAFVFVALDLRDGNYSRSDLATLARQFNKPFASPVIVLFRHGQTLSLASVARRESKTAAGAHVLQKVSMLKEIRINNPHAAHRQILNELNGAKNGAHNWAEFHARWNAVLDISELNRRFYRDYKMVFEAVEAQVRGIAATATHSREHRVRDWTQRLFNRLLFLRFLEKKGWLEFDGSHDYLRALWQAPRDANQTFLRDRLHWTFFHGLNTTGEDREAHALPALVERRGHVPFLNGGLFDLQDELDVKGAVTFADENLVFNSILGLFERYVFTVAENTPLEEEVGVDPEMLGKVFEELVTGRHESGSYYTPRGIVAYMAREAIKGYLTRDGEPRAALEKFVDDDDASALRDPEAVLRALREVTVCDPACGSGAYLLGMMSELLRLRATLFVAHAKDYDKIVERKLEIIARNLYGVDKDPFATNIAMLRLWLSLVVEYEGQTPPPLPNLKYKIENGDSLAAPLGGQLTLDQNTVDEFNARKAAFVKASGDDKRQLEGEIETLRADLKRWSQSDEGFDWRIEFAEIFAPGARGAGLPPSSNRLNLTRLEEGGSPASDNSATDSNALTTAGGFDIVLANPPFVTNGLISPDYKRRMTANLGAAHTANTMDLYCYFYLRGFELLKAGGELAFISPNKWFRAAYGAKLRAFFAGHAHVQTIVDFGDLPVFQSATAYPMVFLARKTDESGATHFTKIESLAAPYPAVLELVKRDGALLPATAIQGANWNLSDAQTFARLETMRKSGVPLGEYSNTSIYSGIKTGMNAAFWIDGATRLNLVKADSSSAKIIKPLTKGENIQRWRIEDSGLYIIYTPPGIDINLYPAVKEYLTQFQSQLSNRAIKQPWWELQQAQNKGRVWDETKIIYPSICKAPRFTLDKEAIYSDMKGFILPSEDLYLLGVLNSESAFAYFIDACSILRGGYIELKRQHVERLIIPNASGADQSAIASLVEACLSRRGQGCEAEEAEINARVAALYGLDEA